MSATPFATIESRFIDEIRLRGYDDKYIDRNEEREILQIALHQGMGLDQAREALVHVCREHGFVLESTLVHQVRTALEGVAKPTGLRRDQFDAILAQVRPMAEGKRSDRDLQRLIVLVMEDTGNNRVATGWLRNWYTALKRDLGVS